MTVVVAVALAFLVSLLGSGIYLRLARRWQLLDIPNHRSAHTQPTPRGGGLGIFLGLFAAMLWLAAMGFDWPQPYLVFTGLAALLVAAGLVDDRFNLPVLVRFALYAGACGVAVWFVAGGLAGWWLALLVFYSLWVLNLFNFMDGIDGIAASEAVFVLSASAALSLWSGGDGAFPLYCLLLAVACLAFLHWNWAPARLFMGDAGSVPLGFLLALLAVYGELQGQISWASSLLLLAVFIGDATYTLLWRARHGEKITEAHSRHLYQRLARHWRSHSRVVWVMLAYNVVWLLPLAAAASLMPGFWWIWLPAGYLPLLPALVKAGKLP